MFRRFLQLALVMSFSAPLLLVGCGDDGGGDPDGGNGNGDGGGGIDSTPAPDATPALTGIDALCDEDVGVFLDFFNKVISCNPLFDFFFGDFVDDARLSEACYGQFGDYVDDGTLVIDDTELANCLAWIQSTECTLLDLDRASECDAAIVGQVAVNGDCDIDEQCAGDTYCAGGVMNGGGPSCGVCTNTLANGVGCTDPSQCSSDHCSNTGICANIGEVGDSCDLGDDQTDQDDNDDCLGMLVCNTSTLMCEEPPDWAVNDACDATEIMGACGFPFSGLYCNGATDMCTAVPAVGQACSAGPTLIPCNVFDYEWCDAQGTGQCAAPNTVNTAGLTCNIAFFEATNECAAGMACSTFESDMNGPLGVCYVPRDDGESCNDTDQQCLPLLECHSGVCGYNQYSGMCPAP